MKTTEQYTNSIHRIGRIGTFFAIVIMIGIPVIFCTANNIMPNINDILKCSGGLIALFLPVAISEVISYVPILGSSSYITFITGNVMNLKVPCAMNAMKMAGAEQNTEEGDAVATVAVAASSILTTIIIACGVLLLVPLRPLLESVPVKTATAYMLPALFGCLFLSQLAGSSGNSGVKGKEKVIIAPIILLLLINWLIIPIKGLEGIFIIFCIPLVILSARVLYKKGIVKVVSNKSEAVDETVVE